MSAGGSDAPRREMMAAPRQEKFMDIPSTAPDVAFSREIFARALSRKAPAGALGDWLTLPEAQDAATEIKAAIRAYSSAAMKAAVVDGYVPHTTGYLDPTLADPLDENTIARAIQARVKAGYRVRTISRGPAMTALQTAIQKIKELTQPSDTSPFFNHAEYVLEFSNLDRAEWDVAQGLESYTVSTSSAQLVRLLLSSFRADSLSCTNVLTFCEIRSSFSGDSDEQRFIWAG